MPSGEYRYWIVALQSWWDGTTKTTYGCPVPTFAGLIADWLASVAGGSMPADSSPSAACCDDGESETLAPTDRIRSSEAVPKPPVLCRPRATFDLFGSARESYNDQAHFRSTRIRVQSLVSTFLTFVMLADIAFGCCGPACALTRKVSSGKTLPAGPGRPLAVAPACPNPCCQHRQPAAPRTEAPANREAPPAAPSMPCPCCHRDSTYLIPPPQAEGVDLDLFAVTASLDADRPPLVNPTTEFGWRTRPCWFLSGRDMLRAYQVMRC
jgi:hypothetical protein